MTRATLVVEENVGMRRWRLVDALRPADPPGSMVDAPPGGPRRVLWFGWVGGVPGVWDPEGVRLADLRVGPFERVVVREEGGPVRVRWSLLT